MRKVRGENEARPDSKSLTVSASSIYRHIRLSPGSAPASESPRQLRKQAGDRPKEENLRKRSSAKNAAGPQSLSIGTFAPRIHKSINSPVQTERKTTRHCQETAQTSDGARHDTCVPPGLFAHAPRR